MLAELQHMFPYDPLIKYYCLAVKCCSSNEFDWKVTDENNNFKSVKNTDF